MYNELNDSYVIFVLLQMDRIMKSSSYADAYIRTEVLSLRYVASNRLSL